MKSSTHYRDKIIDASFVSGPMKLRIVLSELLRFLDDETLGDFYNQRNGPFDGFREED